MKGVDVSYCVVTSYQERCRLCLLALNAYRVKETRLGERVKRVEAVRVIFCPREFAIKPLRSLPSPNKTVVPGEEGVAKTNEKRVGQEN